MELGPQMHNRDSPYKNSCKTFVRGTLQHPHEIHKLLYSFYETPSYATPYTVLSEAPCKALSKPPLLQPFQEAPYETFIIETL